MPTPKHVMPAAAYDRLVEESVKWGGVGPGRRYVNNAARECPWCVMGLAEAVGLLPDYLGYSGWDRHRFMRHYSELRAELFGADITESLFDELIKNQQIKLGREVTNEASKYGDRVPLIPVLDAAGITRGDD